METANPAATTSALADPFTEWRDVEPETFAPVLEPESLKLGIIVKHMATKKVTKDGKTYTLHTFASRGGPGKQFALWGSVALDGKLRNLPAGSVIGLVYGGKQPEDPADPKSKTPHVWHVRVPKPQQLEGALRQLAGRHLQFDAMVDAVAENQRIAREAARQQGRETDFPPPDESQADAH